MQPTFVLSGFDDARGYRRRKPSWEPEESHPDLDAATVVARTWLSSRSADALVEVIEITHATGRVRRVVSQQGVEEV
jgi:hypothetical protein